MDKETTGVISVQFKSGPHPNMYFIGALSWEQTYILGGGQVWISAFSEIPTIDEFQGELTASGGMGTD